MVPELPVRQRSNRVKEALSMPHATWNCVFRAIVITDSAAS